MSERPNHTYKVPEDDTWEDQHLHQIALMAYKSLTLTPMDVVSLYPEVPYPELALQALKHTCLPGRLMQIGDAGFIDLAVAICKRAEEKAWEQWGVRDKTSQGDEECPF